MVLSSVLEPVFVLVSWSSIIAYHFHLVYIVRRKPLTTTVGITNQVRCKWVQCVMEDRRDILANKKLRDVVDRINLLTIETLRRQSLGYHSQTEKKRKNGAGFDL